MSAAPAPDYADSAGNKKEPVKSLLAAMLYLIILGQVGGHQFYLRRYNSACYLLTLGLVGWASSQYVIGWLFLLILWFTLLMDVVRLQYLVLDANLKYRMYQEL